jgi:hypothetical protein
MDFSQRRFFQAQERVPLSHSRRFPQDAHPNDARCGSQEYPSFQVKASRFSGNAEKAFSRYLTIEGFRCIVKAAVTVFGSKGFRLALMEEIAEEAGVSAGTIYNHFKNKVHLFSYILQNGIPEAGIPAVACRALT